MSEAILSLLEKNVTLYSHFVGNMEQWDNQYANIYAHTYIHFWNS